MKRFIQRIVRNIVLWAFDREDTMVYMITMQRLLNRTIAIESRLLKDIRAIREQYGPIKVISTPRSQPLVKSENSKHINK